MAPLGPHAVARLPNAVVTCPITPRETTFSNGPIAITSTTQASGFFVALLKCLHEHFTTFHREAARLTDLIAQGKMAPNSHESIMAVHKYSASIVRVMSDARLQIRNEATYELDSALRTEADVLTLSLAVWELVHVLFLDSEYLYPYTLLKWFYRHFAMDEKHEWIDAAMSCEVNSPEYWGFVLKLASHDLKDDVCRVLERVENTRALCDLLRSLPSLQQIEATSRNRSDYDDHMKQLKARAKAAIGNNHYPSEAEGLLSLYAGLRIEPVGWLDDLIFSYAWMSQSSEARLGPLLRKVVSRQRDEELGPVDEVLFAAFSLDLTRMLERLDQHASVRPFFVTHLVDILYFAGRIPEASVREWYLSQYANYLCDENQQLLAVNYLEGGLTDQLRLCVEQLLGNSSADDADVMIMIKSLKSRPRVLEVISQPPNTLRSMCRVRSMRWKTNGDVARCIYWACHAEAEGDGRGVELSEVLDSLLQDAAVGLDKVLEVFKAPGGKKSPSLTVFSKAEALALPNVPSGRLFFVAQYVEALRSQNPNILAQLLTCGSVPPHLVSRVIKDILTMDSTALGAETLLAITELYQVNLHYDALERADVSLLKTVRKPLVHALAQSLLRTPSKG